MKPATKGSAILFLELLLVVMVLVVCDRAVGAFMKHLYFRQQSGDGYLKTYAIDSTCADILVLGSSRAKHSYVPAVFKNSLDVSCFNAGKDGTQHFLFNYAQFKSITARYIPQVIIFDLRPEDLAYSAKEYDMLSPLLPYYKTHPEIREVLDKRSPLEKLKHISAMYPYNSLIFQVIVGNLEFNKDRKPHSSGFVPFHGSRVKGSIDTLDIIDADIDEYKIVLLKDMIETCKDSGARLILVYSPTWYIVRESKYDKVLGKLCEEHGVEYLNISNYPLFIDNPEYFYDRTHLNEDGAGMFTSLIANKLAEGKLEPNLR